MEPLIQALQDPTAVGTLLVAVAAGGLLVLLLALLLLRMRERELNTLREELGTARNAGARLEADKTALDRRLDEAQRERDRRGQELNGLRAVLENARIEIKRLETETKNDQERIALLEQADARLGDTFKALAADALRDNRKTLVEDLKRSQDSAQEDLQHRQRAVEDIVRPISETLAKLQQSQTSLDTRIMDLRQNAGDLHDQTRRLVNALRRPEQRGRWGELQLRRCVELAGMQHYVDFVEQESVPGAGQRPDMIVYLPNERRIVVDAKTPMDAYISAWETQDEEERQQLLEKHAGQVRRNLDLLSQKRYQDSLEQSPDFVVMFLPGEVFYSAALEQQPTLFEHGMESRVLIATPTILVALLRSVHMGWREAELAREAEEIGRQGQELYRRTRKLVEHIANIRKGLDNSVRAYNAAVGSLNDRFVPQVERFRQLKSIDGEELPELEPVSADLRKPRRFALKTGADRETRD